MKIRVGAAWGKAPYSTLSVMAITIASIAGEMSKSDALQAMRREREREREREEVIPDPTYGYLRRRLLGRREIDGFIRNDL